MTQSAPAFCLVSNAQIKHYFFRFYKLIMNFISTDRFLVQHEAWSVKKLLKSKRGIFFVTEKRMLMCSEKAKK
jgi:hypothetical protein